MTGEAPPLSTDTAAFSRVLVVAPRTRVDVALPTDIALVEMMPQLLDMVGERSDDAGASHDGWHLQSLDGTELDQGKTLRALAILDGTAMRLLPRRPVDPDPIYDDVVEAIADSVQAHTSTADLRSVVAAVCAGAGVLTAAMALGLGGGSWLAALVAALGSVGVLIAATSLARSTPARVVAVTLAATGTTLAFAAGWSAIPGASGGAAALLAAVAAVAYAVIAAMLLGTGTQALSAVGTIAALTAVGGLSAVLWVAPASSHLIVASVVGLAGLALLPRMAVRMARLPMPLIPTSAEHLRQEAAGTDFRAVKARAAVASEYLTGTSLGCLVVAAAGAAAAASTGSLFGVLYAAAALGALLLRIRSTPGRDVRLGLLLTSTVAGASGLVIWAWHSQEVAPLLVAVIALAVVAIAAVSAAVGPRPRSNPMSGRSLDLLESALLVAVLPLALGAIDLYSIVRHL